MNKSILKINILSLLFAFYLIFGVSLDASGKSAIDGFDPISFNIGSGSGSFGETVCVDVTVENFDRVEGMQFSINYNSNLLSIVCPADVSNSPLDQTELFFNCMDDDGTVRVFWTDPNSAEADGVSVPDGDLIFTLCFDIVGTCGLSSQIIISSDPLPLEVYQISESATSCENEEIIVNPGIIGIICPEMVVVARDCNATPVGNDGTLSFYIAGGTGPYTYIVNPGAISGSATEAELIEIQNLGTGNYTISATDISTGQIIDQNIFIGEDLFPLEVNLDATDPYCFNRNKGSIEATVTLNGNEVPANYEWSTFQFTQDIDDLGSGTYTVTVTDLNGCSVVESATLFVEPLILHAELIDSASCEGNNDAIVKIWAEGGTPFPPMPTNPEYEYETDAGDAGPTDTLLLNDVETGIFNFSVIDAAIPLCQVDSFIEIPFKGVDLSMILDTVDVSCIGANDGSVTITGVGSTNFGFIVRNDMNMLMPGAGTPTQQTFSDLSPGCYTILVIESFNGCEITGSFCIEEPTNPLIIATDDVINPGCVGNDGMISITSSGGTEPYMYIWSDGPSPDEDRTGLFGGMYTVTVTDDRGCTDTAMFDLPDGSDVQINANVVQAINCPQDQNGIIDVNISTGGTFTYNWELPDGTFLSDMQTVSNLGSGVYYVTATDATASCIAIDTVVLAAASPIAIEGNFTQPTCAGVPNGSIGIVDILGTTPFTYLWENQSTQQVLSGISDGIYNVTVTDANMCELDTFLTLTAPDPILVSFSDIVGVDCFDAANGSITATANGGPDMSGTYTYFWSNDPSNGLTGATSNQSGFAAGENWVIATDFFCASDTAFFMIPDIDSITIDLVNSIINSPSCFGDCDGLIDITATGGNSSSYDYLWLDDNSLSPTRTNLCAGTYDVMITDANGCSVTRSIEFLNPVLLSATTIELNSVGCNENSGSLLVETTGGTEPFLYQWTDNISSDSVATNLGAGTYNILITDANNCTAETSYILTSTEPIIATLAGIDEPNCFGDQTCIGIGSVTGGIGSDYTFSTIVAGGFNYPIDSCALVFAGEHTITVTDSSGTCTWDTTIIINQPDELMIDAGPDQEIDLGSISESISPSISSTLPIDSIIWSPLDSLDCIDVDCEEVISNTLIDQLYTVTVTDINGCSATDDIFIKVNTSRNVYIANIFTPDGDGNNDYFNLVIGSGAVSVSYLSIYDRWGNRVFSIENEYIPEIGQQDGWDGKHNGQYVNPGVYVYTAQVNFLDGRVLQYSGDVTVIR